MREIISILQISRVPKRYRMQSQFRTPPEECKILLSSTNPVFTAISAHVDQEDKTTTLIQGDGSNYKSKTTLINESGLYSLILSSKFPKAKEFKRQ